MPLSSDPRGLLLAPRRPGLSRRGLLALGGAAALGSVATARTAWAGGAHFDWTLAGPDAGGFSAAGLANVRATIQKHIEAADTPGAVSAIVRNGKLVWYEALGFRDPVAGEPMRKDDIFRMMSSTKHVTAIAVLMMIEDGKLSLDDKVSRFIPTFKDMKVAVLPPGVTDISQAQLVPAEREITIEHLLTHTSGITSVGDKLSPSPAAALNRIQRAPDETLETWTRKLGTAVLDFQPGTRFSYSPTDALDVALRIVEITSGQPADVFLRERLFEPLDMRDTGFNLSAAQTSRLVKIFGRINGQWSAQDHVFGPGPYRYFSGGGGLFGTVHDFINLEFMLLNRGQFNGRRILRPESVALMTRDHAGALFRQWIPPLTAGHGFGLTVRIVEDPAKANGRGVGAFGWGGAYGTDSWVDPQRQMVAAFFQQVKPLTFAVENDFEKAVHAAIVS
ncbi:serine hydrolase domain-containing protein [Caulobacter rhizosphaerae]|uniref:serine hydrolase domain-containing protein n=1 Tax=Caulobacter rhizosphaerae TaxID=2010972 RepID=UPI0013D43797|nr:serine hydrolase domain-containing protein [Caulobacter rhizosphaerae]